MTELFVLRILVFQACTEDAGNVMRSDDGFKSIPIYTGKPTLYLDQNILDLLVKYGIDALPHQLYKEFQVVYSDETLKEIKRSKGYESDFLNVLSNLDAYHLQILVERPGFVVTDQAIITKRDVTMAFKEYCTNSEEFQEIEKAMSQWLFKLSGGRANDTFSDIHTEQQMAFGKLIEEMNESLDELPDEIRKEVRRASEVLTEEFENSIHNLEKTIEKDIPESRGLNGIKLFRESVGIGPAQLNNLDSPNVAEKIWEIFKGGRYQENSM